ncbi:MAG: ribonuclease P protein component 4 [Halobacteriota archaeon]
MSRRRRTRKGTRDIVGERIDRLFDLAYTEFATSSARSDRYVQHARCLATKYRVKLGKRYKTRFCRRCGAFFVYGINARVRIKDRRTVITCLRCHQFRRY